MSAAQSTADRDAQRLSAWLGPWLFALVALAWSAPAGRAQADVVRFGLFIGNNRGAAHELPLRYAGSDAQRLQEVLVDLGGLAPANTIVLAEPDADAARRALIALNERVRAFASRPDTRVMLFVYYSGHADPEALHLGKTRLALLELEQLVRGSAANVRVLLLDACGAGALTRMKGGSPGPPFPSIIDETLEGEGVAILAASSAREDAQESDELRGSIFTHHLISGLMGAADLNRDRRVDLDEAYGYAYESTLRSTSRTWAGTQHPTFRFELAGSAKVVLSDLDHAAQRAMLVFPKSRDYLVLRDSAHGPVVAELMAGRAQRRLSVRPGTYFLRGRAADYVLEGTLSLREGETRRVDEDLLERIEYARLVRKGKDVVRNTSGPLAGYTLRSEITGGAGLCQGLFAGYAFVLPSLTLTPRLDACRSRAENQVLTATSQELGGSLRVAHAWDFPVVTLEAGLALGASWLRQSFSTSGYAPTRDSAAFRTTLGPAANLELGAGLYLITDVAAEIYVLRVYDAAARTSDAQASVTVRAGVGLGKNW